MSFDALTIIGILAVVVCGGFLVALVKRNDPSARVAKQLAASEEGSPVNSRP